MATHSAFFYGTLMAPSVLQRVTRGVSSPKDQYSTVNEGSFAAQPAILSGYRRHRVREADYPAILPASGSEVRGTFVSGLTDADIWRLDVFEGSEYDRRKVTVSLLPASLSQDTTNDRPLPPKAEGETISAQQETLETHSANAKATKTLEADTYVWIAGKDLLEDEEWDFEVFVKEKMWRWAGTHEDVLAVDEAVANQEDPTRGRAFGVFEEKVADGPMS